MTVLRVFRLLITNKHSLQYIILKDRCHYPVEKVHKETSVANFIIL